MKKFRNIFLAVLMAVYWPFFYATSAYAALDSYSVVRLATATAGYSGTTLEVPVLVNAFKGATKALQWGTAALTPELGAAIVTRIAGATAVTAAAIYGPQLVSYLYDKGYQYIQDELTKAVPGAYGFNSSTLATIGVSNNSQVVGDSSMLPADLVLHAIDSGLNSCPSSYPIKYSGWGNYMQVGGVMIKVSQAECQGAYALPSANIYAPQDINSPVIGAVGEATHVPLTESDKTVLAGLIQTDLENANPAAQNLQKAILEAVKDIIENPSGTLAVQNPAIAAAVKGLVNSAVDDATKTNLEAQTQSPTAVQDYALSISVNNASTLTKAEVEKAIKNANAAKTAAEAADIANASMSSMEPEQLPPTPTKLSLTAILTSYTSGLLNLPILSFLQNKGITTLSGSPDITIDFGSIIGLGNMGSATVGLGDYASTFQFMGNILLAITGWRWTLYIFEG